MWLRSPNNNNSNNANYVNNDGNVNNNNVNNTNNGVRVACVRLKDTFVSFKNELRDLMFILNE